MAVGNGGPPSGTAADEDYEEPLWRFVKDWPQVSAHLRRTLDAELIPDQAVAVLRRSLDFNRVIGFIGSGVSMAYGRLGWGDLIKWMASGDTAKRVPKGFETVERITVLGRRPAGDAPADGGRATATQRLMQRLLKDLNIEHRDAGDDLQSGRYPAAFQFLEQCALAQADTAGDGGAGGADAGESRVRRCLRAMLRDDSGHACLLFESLLADLADEQTYPPEDWQPPRAMEDWALAPLLACWRTVNEQVRSGMDPDSPTWQHPLADAPWRSAFTLRRPDLDRLSAALSADAQARQLCTDVAAALFTSPGATLAPLHRFAVLALARLDPPAACATLWRPAGMPAECPASRGQRVLPASRDPLLILLRDFGITRFSTTNYDVDIERTIFDTGYDTARKQGRAEHLPPAPGRSLARNALGMAAHDTVFRHAHAAQLLRFATGRPSAIQVMHLHGRVFPGEDLVVTEDDYQRLYLQRSDIAEAATDAIALGFRSNTVLFVGSGMSEDDVLRPLRQFMTEKRSSADRSGVVLLPADGSRAREIDEVIALYSRYGVLTKHYGTGHVADEQAPPVRWLASWLWVQQRLKLAVKALMALPAATADARGDAICQVRNLLAGRPSWHGESQPWEPRRINGCELGPLLRSMALGTDFRGITEIALLCAITRSVLRLIDALAGPDPTAVPPAWLDAARKATVPPAAPAIGAGPERATRRLLLALQALLDGVGGALRGLAMTLELASLQQSWQHWKQDRRTPPAVRPVGARRRPLRSPKGPAYPPYIFARNLLALRQAGPAGQPALNFDWPVPMTDRFMQQAPSHTFSKFVQALEHRARDVAVDAGRGVHGFQPEGVGGRRSFLLLARRGLGKGHFFEMMAEPDSVARFIEASWRAAGRQFDVGGQRCVHPGYAVTCYVNLGVTLEFLSAFDRLSLVLVDMAPQVFPQEPGDERANVAWQILQAAEKLSSNRLARLQAVLRLYAENAPRAQRRLLIAFNGFGQFFDRLGAPKNAQLHRLIQALIGPAAAQVPIDVLMVCQDVDLPGQFRTAGLQMPIAHNRELDRWSHLRGEAMVLLDEPGPDARARRKLDEALQAMDLAVTPDPHGRGAWVYVMRGAHASATVGKYFPGVALALALATLKVRIQLQCRPSDVRDIQDAIIAAARDDLQAVERLTLDLLTTLARAGERLAPGTTGCTLGALLHRALSTTAAKPVPAAAPAKLPARPESADALPGQLMVQHLKTLKDSPELNDPAHTQARSHIDDRFRQLHRAVRANRYLLTIVCAAASERGWHPTDEQRGIWQFDPAEIERWLASVELEVANQIEGDAIDRIIARVLVSHQQQHDLGSMPLGWSLPEAADRSADEGADPPQGTLLARLLELGAALKTTAAAAGLAAPAADAVPPTAAAVAHQLHLALCGPLAWRLQRRLLWHLAVMALEVQADVLASAPLVEADCALLVAQVLGTTPRRIRPERLRRLGISRLLVERMLDLLVHRCLVFRMEPVQLGPEEVRAHYPTQRPASEAGFAHWYARHYPVRGDAAGSKQGHAEGERDEKVEPPAAAQSGWRFTIHRFLQRIILEQLKSPFIEFPKVDQFGLSLWSTQPDDLPRPDPAAAHDIADLVAAWIGFPKDAASMRSTSTYHWFRKDAGGAADQLLADTGRASWNDSELWRRTTLPARMLRAALGVVRATYSVGVVSRFQGFGDGNHGLAVPEEGYFKQHHLQVRWLLEQAKLLQVDERLKRLLARTAASESALSAWWGLAMEAAAPFYVDELVWLNNECGLFCLVEGRLDNAAGMFRQALLAAEDVEGQDLHGALWCRITLNLAVLNIERGRLREADTQLAVIEGVNDENPILRILARGFRALVEHLSGNLAQAQETYEKVIKDLVLLGQQRAVAIFSRHLSELHRLQGPDAAPLAFQAIEQSIAAATRSGHEDVRNLALLSRVRLAIAGVLPPTVLEKARLAVQTDLDAIERYGHTMGMPRLLADVAFARSIYLLNLGETRHAARLTHRCLELCVANGLRLRQMMGMALLGRIYRKRGLASLAEPLFAQAYAMAVDFNYGNLREVASHPGAMPGDPA